ncbi:MAG: hypothetical protein FWD61_11070 [Phycisphaerales bacterium]|nr:hypothetical protein [Phycisphaerales bacterium]
MIRTSKLLKEHGADINAKDKEGKTPLAVVTTVCGDDAKNWLLANGAK